MTATNNYTFFKVEENNMFDGSHCSIMIGDVLICKRNSKQRVPDLINAVIVHKTKGILFGQILKNGCENITLHSLNPAYQDKSIKVNDIEKIFQVVKFQRCN